jgi:hypothetical protein
MYNKAGFDLTTHNSAGGDETTRPLHQSTFYFYHWIKDQISPSTYRKNHLTVFLQNSKKLWVVKSNKTHYPYIFDPFIV